MKTLTGYTPANTYTIDSRGWHEVATGHQAQNIFDKLLTNPNIKIIADNRIEVDSQGYILS